MKNLIVVLNTLGLDAEDCKTYLSLLETGPLPAGKLAKRLGIARSTLYGFLKRLSDRGLVIESQQRSIKLFTAEHPDKINSLFAERAEQLQKNQEIFRDMLPELRKKQGQKLLTPRLRLFEGPEALRQVLKDMLLYSEMETQAFWPIQNMLDVLGADFFRYLNKGRIKNKLHTRAVWPAGQVVDVRKHPYLGSGKEFLREIRVAPETVDAAMGYWIYGGKVALISSQKESFGFIVESTEFARMLLAQFNLLWQVSIPLKTTGPETAAFIAELNRHA